MLPKKSWWLVASGLVVLLAAIWLIKFKPPSNTLGVSEKQPFDHTLVFIGDSMTEYLGNFDELRADLKHYYPNQNILLLNYAYSATNILSVKDRLEKDSAHSNRTFQAVNEINFDYVFIESMGHNPLSEHPLAEGLKLQTQALDEIVASLTIKHPKSAIIFVATISPNRDRYAERVADLSTKQRQEWSDERSAYIKNHIKYAVDHQIPLINVFEKSLDESGTGSISYISSGDFIHPSPTGIYFISQEIADFIHKNNLI